jgi:site-specific DNA-methyltransferase (adenine-specific)
MGHYFRRRHEFILFASKGKRPVKRRDIPDIWTHQRIHNTPYPTQKPVELFEQMVTASTEPGFVVCDPFMGSGSSAIAALKHGCSFWGCDIAEKAVQMTNARINFFMEYKFDNLRPDKPYDEETATAKELMLFEKGARYGAKRKKKNG